MKIIQKSTKIAITACKFSKLFRGSMPPDPLQPFLFLNQLYSSSAELKDDQKNGNYGPLFEVFCYATASPIFSVESRTSEECVDLFFCFPIRVTLTIIVVEHIELDPSNNPAREGLRLPTCGPLTKTVAHPWLIAIKEVRNYRKIVCIKNIIENGWWKDVYPSSYPLDSPLAVSYRNHQKNLAYFSHLAPLQLFLFTTSRVKRGAWLNGPTSKYAPESRI